MDLWQWTNLNYIFRYNKIALAHSAHNLGKSFLPCSSFQDKPPWSLERMRSRVLSNLSDIEGHYIYSDYLPIMGHA